MKSEMHEFCLRATVPCGFADSDGGIKANAKMVDFLGLNKDAPEMVILLEKIRTEKSPFFVIINLVSDFKRSPTVWQFHFLPLFCSENGYLGTFFHAHEFLFLSPLEYVDGMQPYAVTTEKPSKLFTDKEWQVLFFTMHRFSSKEIARRLNIFPSTVESHLKTIYRKVDVHSACQLRAFCRGKGINRFLLDYCFLTDNVLVPMRLIELIALFINQIAKELIMSNVDSEDFLPFYPAFPELSHSQVDTVLWIRMHFSSKDIARLKNIRHDSLRRELSIIREKLSVLSEKQLESLVDKRLLIFSLCPGALSKITLIHKSK